jgi:hypothetical protein
VVQQRRVTAALREYIGKICHVYLDDIVVWSETVEEHDAYVCLIFDALKRNGLYCNERKTKLFWHEIDFLGHHISQRGIEPDKSKIERIVNWPVPKSSTNVRAFLGLVRYLSRFLQNLAVHTEVLHRLTTKDADKNFPEWNTEHQFVFNQIKAIVTSTDCLTTMDHENMGENRIFVTADASNKRSGAVLSYGPTWETAWPVAFDSMTFKGAELNYPIHEKELLAIIRALRRWQADLIGSHILVYTDHCTLENFESQKDLSRRQAQWMEFMSQFYTKIIYVKGDDNTVTDALSRTEFVDSAEAELHTTAAFDDADADVIATLYSPAPESPFHTACCLARTRIRVPDPTPSPTPHIWAIMSIGVDDEFLDTILVTQSTLATHWTPGVYVLTVTESIPGLRSENCLWYIGSRLIIPRAREVHETLFCLAHNVLGHFGFEKSYGSLRNEFYWPNMRRDLKQGYIPSCPDCQRNKSRTNKHAGPLHPLPIPDGQADSVTIDFIGPLPKDKGHNCIATFMDRLSSDFQLVATHANITAEDFALLFFDHWYCENGLSLEIISDRDKLFVSKFWAALHKLTGVKLMSTSFHPETDSASERTNKTVNQCICYHVARNQCSWARALPCIRFHLMNSINKSTGYSPFQLKTGRSPRVIPPLLPTHKPMAAEEISAAEIILNAMYWMRKITCSRQRLPRLNNPTRTAGPTRTIKLVDVSNSTPRTATVNTCTQAKDVALGLCPTLMVLIILLVFTKSALQ